MKCYKFIGYMVATAVVSSAITYGVIKHKYESKASICEVHINQDGFIDDIINTNGVVEIFAEPLSIEIDEL